MHKGDPIGAFIYHKEKNVRNLFIFLLLKIYKISMRSHSQEIDLGFICKFFGGGGHKKSASFTETTNYVNNMKIEKAFLANDVNNHIRNKDLL